MLSNLDLSVAGAYKHHYGVSQYAVVEIVGTRHFLDDDTKVSIVRQMLDAIDIDDVYVGQNDGLVFLAFETPGRGEVLGRKLSEFFATTPIIAQPFRIRVGVGETPDLAITELR